MAYELMVLKVYCPAEWRFAVAKVTERHDYIEYGWLRHVDCKPLPVLVLDE